MEEMYNTTAYLHISSTQDFFVVQAVLMLKGAAQHIAENLKVAMAMCAKSIGRRHSVLVEDAQRRPSFELGVIVHGKGEGVVGI